MAHSHPDNEEKKNSVTDQFMMQKNALDFWFIMIISSSQPSTETVTCSVQLMLLSVIQYFPSIPLSFLIRRAQFQLKQNSGTLQIKFYCEKFFTQA